MFVFFRNKSNGTCPLSKTQAKFNPMQLNSSTLATTCSGIYLLESSRNPIIYVKCKVKLGEKQLLCGLEQFPFRTIFK